MLLHIPGVFTRDEVTRIRAALEQAEWADGKVTAGYQSSRAKHNLQLPQDHPLAREIGEWKSRQTRDEELVETLETGEALLKRDLDGVIERVGKIANRTDRPVTDPGLIDFCLEIVTDALKVEPRPGATGQAGLRTTLTRIQFRLLALLDRVRSPDLAVR